MNQDFPRYQAFIKGGVITIGIPMILSVFGFQFTDSSFLYIYLYILVLGWLLLSFLIAKFPLYQVLGLVVLFIATMVIDHSMGIPDNPITLPLIILFWLGVAYLIVPSFFKKYKVVIFSVYGLVITLFLLFRMLPNYLEVHRWTLINGMLIPLPAFIGLWMYEQWRWLSQLKADKAKTELALLKSQLNPHFFFNTLNNLYGLVIEQSEQAPEVVLKLSDMMRYTIYQGKEDQVLLKDEIQYLKNYIELHQIRFQKTIDLSFSHDVDEHLKVAPLLFIVLLENAFKHGVEQMRNQGYIHMHLKSIGPELIFSIENNREEQPSEHSDGIGLDNLKKRLAHLYPDRHDLTIESTKTRYKVQLKLSL